MFALQKKVCTSQPDGQRVWMLTIFSTQVLGLGVNILVNVAVYLAIMSCSRPQVDENIAADHRRRVILQHNHKKLLLPQRYPHKAWGRTLAATDKVSECHRQKWLNSQVFPLQGMHGICCHASVFLIRPTPTHNNTLQVILKISIFRFADPTL